MNPSSALISEVLHEAAIEERARLREERKVAAELAEERARLYKERTQMRNAPEALQGSGSFKSQWWNWVARQRIDPHLPLRGLRDSFGTWVYETGVKQAQEWLGHGDLQPPSSSPPPGG